MICSLKQNRKKRRKKEGKKGAMISYTGREKGGLNKVVEKDFESRLVILQSGQRECRPHIKGSIW